MATTRPGTCCEGDTGEAVVAVVDVFAVGGLEVPELGFRRRRALAAPPVPGP